MQLYVVLAVVVLVLILSAVMAFVPRNQYFGVRCKWSMYNENTWKRSDILGAIATGYACILTIPFALMWQHHSAKIFSAFIVIAAIVSIFGAYFFYKQEVRKH